jgi:hypothetical protein
MFSVEIHSSTQDLIILKISFFVVSSIFFPILSIFCHIHFFIFLGLKTKFWSTSSIAIFHSFFIIVSYQKVKAIQYKGQLIIWLNKSSALSISVTFLTDFFIFHKIIFSWLSKIFIIFLLNSSSYLSVLTILVFHLFSFRSSVHFIQDFNVFSTILSKSFLSSLPLSSSFLMSSSSFGFLSDGLSQLTKWSVLGNSEYPRLALASFNIQIHLI